MPDLIPVREAHRFDEAALAAYLKHHLPDIGGELLVHQFQGGQSNPTYHLQAGDRQYVLRKKPPGQLLPSAHAVDREFRVMQALQHTDVPVPRMYVLCTDDSVIGQAFYVMEYVEGRVFHDRLMPGVAPAERRAISDSMNDAMARLHRVDWQAVGLADFGKPHGYIGRQIKRWSSQYVASKVEECPAMDRVMDWLQTHAPQQAQTSVVHGDFRLGNLLIHPTEPRVIAVLDWELATLGDPLSDLGYNLAGYFLPHEVGMGLQGLDLAAMGIPSLDDCLGAYCRRTGRAGIADFPVYVVFSLFRSAAISAGVYRRGLDGNAADASALERGRTYRAIAEYAWELAARERPG